MSHITLSQDIISTYNSFHLVLSTEGAVVFAVLGDLHLLDGLPQAGSVPGAVLAGDPNLLGALGHPLDVTSESNHSERESSWTEISKTKISR